MRTQSAALGVVAAAAFSSAASALPCAATAPDQTTPSGLSCTVDAEIASSPMRDLQADKGAAAPQGDSQPTDQPAFLVDIAEVTDAATFDGRGVKITNLQATMTSNKYVAGHLPLVSGTPAVDDLILLSPDYLSIKLLPHIPKRNPVGVGLVTVPKAIVKDADTALPGQGLQQKRP
jgi:hypothetical protein